MRPWLWLKADEASADEREEKGSSRFDGAAGEFCSSRLELVLCRPGLVGGGERSAVQGRGQGCGGGCERVPKR